MFEKAVQRNAGRSSPAARTSTTILIGTIPVAGNENAGTLMTLGGIPFHQKRRCV